MIKMTKKQITFYNKWLKKNETMQGIDYKNHSVVNTRRDSHIIVKDGVSLHEVVTERFAKVLIDSIN